MIFASLRSKNDIQMFSSGAPPLKPRTLDQGDIIVRIVPNLSGTSEYPAAFPITRRKIEQMVNDKDIYRAAKGLAKNHGEKAAIECAERAERWEKLGDKKAADLWWRVMSAVKEIQNQLVN
jgi:hypothetical protein